MTLTSFDIVLLILMLFMIIRSSIKGFVAEFFSKAAVILAIMAAILFYRPLSPYVVRISGADSLTQIISFLLLFLVVYLVVKLIQQVVGKAFEGESMTNLDRALGFFLGIAEGFLLILFLLFIIKSQHFIDLSFITRDSFFSRIFEPFLSEGKGILPHLFPLESI